MRQTIVKTTLLALGNNLWYLSVSLPQEIQDLSDKFSLILVQWHDLFQFIG